MIWDSILNYIILYLSCMKDIHLSTKSLMFFYHVTIHSHLVFVLYCTIWSYTDYWRQIRPLSYRHSSGVVRNPHSTLAKWGIFNLRSMSPQVSHLLIARRRNFVISVFVFISRMTCLSATCEPRIINLSITGERITFTL